MLQVTKQKTAKGSRRWLQELVNQRPALLNDAIRTKMGLSGQDKINWLSPLEREGYAEYKDQPFLDKISVRLEKRPLEEFWPSGGAVWDALGRTSRGDVLLVEAKARISELGSTCQASPSSMTLIQKSLAETKQFFGAPSTADWSQTHYQYANRLAHLYLLRELNGIPAWLIFLYFVNAEDVAGPRSAEAWRPAIDAIHAHLGVTRDRLGPHVIDLFLDQRPIQM
jgi:hypothetical protein